MGACFHANNNNTPSIIEQENKIQIDPALNDAIWLQKKELNYAVSLDAAFRGIS